MVVGFDVEKLFKGVPIESEESYSNEYFPADPSKPIPTKDIERINLGEAHSSTVLSERKDNHFIPYSELFGRKIEPEDKIDIENSPFTFLEPSPNADDLDSFTESKMPLDQKRLPPIRTDEVRKKEAEELSKKNKKDENVDEKDVETEEDELEEEEEDSKPADNTLLEKLSSLKNSVLNDHRDSVGFGVFNQNRTGDPGLDTLNLFVLSALDINYFPTMSDHLYGYINTMNLYNGAVSGPALQRYGDKASGGNVGSFNTAYEVMAGYEHKRGKTVYTAEFGRMPTIDALPETPYTWKLKYATESGKFSVDVAYVNKLVKDSMVSRVGDTYTVTDPDTNTTTSGVRGGITKEGIELGGKVSVGQQVLAGNINYYYNISGYKVIENQEVAITLLYLKLLDLEMFDSFMVGPILLYDNYTFNSGYFTMGRDGVGNGGYFSPKDFFLWGLYFDFAQLTTENFFWKIKGNVGLMSFVSGKDILDTTSSETGVKGLGYEVKGFLGYSFVDSIQFLAGAGYQESGPFQSLFFGVSAIYYFGEKKSNTIGDLMYSNTIGEMAK